MKNEKQKAMLRIVGIIALIAVIGFVFAACGGGGKLSGSYSLTGGGDLTYTFSGNKLTMESIGKVLGEGTFSTKGGKLTMSIDGNEQTLDYTLEGKNLILSAGGQKLTFTKK